MSGITLTVTLGHDNCPDVHKAESDIQDAIIYWHGDIVGYAHGQGYWQGTAEGLTVWVAILPTRAAVSSLAVDLSALALKYKQEAIGFIVHDTAYGESYV